MPISAVSRAEALSILSLIGSPPPRSLAERMADIFVTREEDGYSTSDIDLQREGFTEAEIAEAGTEAARIAKTRQARTKTRDLNAPRAKSLEEVGRDMADVIGTLFPPRQIVVAELLSRGFAQKHIDLLLHKSSAMAALDFCQGKTGWAN